MIPAIKDWGILGRTPKYMLDLREGGREEGRDRGRKGRREGGGGKEKEEGRKRERKSNREESGGRLVRCGF